MNEEIPHVDCEISAENIRSEVGAVVTVLRPDWDLDNLFIHEKSTGYINTNFSIHHHSTKDGLFLRIVSTKLPGKLDQAINAMKYLKKHKLGAQLLLTFKNGLVMEYLEGEVVTWENIERVKEPEIWRSMAREMAKWHAETNLDDVKLYQIPDYQTSRDKADAMLEAMEKKQGYVEGLPTVTEVQEWRNKIYQQLVDHGAETAFSHVDSNPTNLIIQDGEVVFVDYDESQLDLSCAEMSRFFLTFCGVLECDLDKVPSVEQQEEFIREYLKKRSELQPERGPVTDKLVEYWMFLVRKSILMGYVGGSVAVRFLGQISDKPLDQNLSHKFWQKFLEVREETLAETFHWD